MKYSELFQLNPIHNVIEIAEADQHSKAWELVSRFVIASRIGTEIEKVALPILDPKCKAEGKGPVVVGNCGTGKSHLMSLLSVIAENADALEWLRDPAWKPKLTPIAGKYKVRRYKMNVPDPAPRTLYDVAAEQLEILAASNGVDFKFSPTDKVSNPKDEFAKFMYAFEAAHPDKSVRLILDEVLEHLRKLNDYQVIRDLALLRALGEFTDGSRLKIMVGVQRSLFARDEFQNVSAEIARIRQRFNDLVIDSKGIEQLIETYLFEKNDLQRSNIKAHLAKHIPLYDVLGQDLDRFTRLFPAHPRFIDEFERVTLVEKREILKVLHAEAMELREAQLSDDVPYLITSDRYWTHVGKDPGLDANLEVRKIKQNVANLTERVRKPLPAEDQAPALRLVRALAVNRLTTASLAAQIGQTPTDLKENLLWYTKIRIPDLVSLTQAAKRSLDKTREPANGQFLTKSANSDHYFIDPNLSRDFEQEVHTEVKTISPHAVQRHLNELILKAVEIDAEKPAIEGRLWNYALEWVDKNTERSGWFFFGYPNSRSTANPPKDFYLFLLPSSRIERTSESFQPQPDEAYWFFEAFPTFKLESGDESAPDTWLDRLRVYAAAKERAGRVRKGLGEHSAFSGMADRLLRDLLPDTDRLLREFG